MAVKVVVQSRVPADHGREWPLAAASTRIGRTPTAQFRLGDEALHGEVLVERTGDAYQVVNQAEHPVTLVREVAGGRRGEEIAPGGRKTWAVGDWLKLTPSTALQLVLGSAPGPEGPSWAARLLPPAVQLALLPVLVTVFGLIVHAALTGRAAPGRVTDPAALAAEVLAELDAPEHADPEWKLLADALKRGREAEARRHRADAKAHYQAARAAVAQLRRTRLHGRPDTDPDVDLVKRATRLVNDKLIALNAE